MRRCNHSQGRGADLGRPRAKEVQCHEAKSCTHAPSKYVDQKCSVKTNTAHEFRRERSNPYRHARRAQAVRAISQQRYLQASVEGRHEVQRQARQRGGGQVHKLFLSVEGLCAMRKVYRIGGRKSQVAPCYTRRKRRSQSQGWDTYSGVPVRPRGLPCRRGGEWWGCRVSCAPGPARMRNMGRRKAMLNLRWRYSSICS